jgi:phosphopantetheine--protein transferase-like protein
MLIIQAGYRSFLHKRKKTSIIVQMAILCGVDIIYIPGIKNILKDEKKLEKFFDATELTNTSAEHLAGIIAAKEAFFKALGEIPRFRDIQIAYKDSHKPYLIISPELQKYQSIDVSISHDKDYATAFVVIEK